MFFSNWTVCSTKIIISKSVKEMNKDVFSLV